MKAETTWQTELFFAYLQCLKHRHQTYISIASYNFFIALSKDLDVDVALKMEFVSEREIIDYLSSFDHFKIEIRSQLLYYMGNLTPNKGVASFPNLIQSFPFF